MKNYKVYFQKDNSFILLLKYYSSDFEVKSKIFYNSFYIFFIREDLTVLFYPENLKIFNISEYSINLISTLKDIS